MIRKGKLLIDTSGWLSYLGDSQPYHQEVVAIYQDFVRRKRSLVTTSYVIAELTALAVARNIISQQHIVDFVDRLNNAPNLEIVHIDAAIYQAALTLLRERPDKEWTLADAASFVIMQQRGITEALTLDHHFMQAGFIRLPEQA